MKNTLYFVLVIAAGSLFAWAADRGMEAQDRSSCFKWQQEAVTFRNTYYLTQLQEAQCKYFGVEIDAPVKK